MARAFSGTDLINCASAASLDNINAGTVLSWVYYTTAAANGVVYRKGVAAGAAHALQRLSTSRFNFRIARVTTPLDIQAADASCTGSGVDKWVFFAATFDTAGANGDQHIYTGDRVTVAAEASAYAVQQVGTGAVGDDSGDDFIIGNSSAGSIPWVGRIGIVQILNVILTAAQIRSWQWGMRWMTGTQGLWIPGHDDGTSVPDYSGNRNTGTITGTTIAAALPHLYGGYLGLGDAEDQRSESVPITALWPDRRRRAIAAALMYDKRLRVA